MNFILESEAHYSYDKSYGYEAQNVNKCMPTLLEKKRCQNSGLLGGEYGGGSDA